MASCQDLHTFGSERYATSAPTVNFRLVEASDPKAIVAFVSKYTFWNDANVVPVVDIAESVPINAASLGWAQSASKS